MMFDRWQTNEEKLEIMKNEKINKNHSNVSIDFDYVFLKWQDYPPDASHGFYIGSSVITSLLPLAKNYTGIPQNESYIESR